MINASKTVGFGNWPVFADVGYSGFIAVVNDEAM